MQEDERECRIKIIKDGPYVVSGNVPLSEKIIIPKGKGYEYKAGRELPQAEEYHLCRCGKSKNAPFCDGAHEKTRFVGTETATRDKYEDRAKLYDGEDIDLLDDNRCAFARFCHTELGKTWKLLEDSDKMEYRNAAIKSASDCPAGRLTAIDKTGNAIEPKYEPSIGILQDSEREVSAGIFVKGNIPIEAADGHIYEIRNRAVLCRCDKSMDRPFCDATHVSIEFLDKK